LTRLQAVGFYENGSKDWLHVKSINALKTNLNRRLPGEFLATNKNHENICQNTYELTISKIGGKNVHHCATAFVSDSRSIADIVRLEDSFQ